MSADTRNIANQAKNWFINVALPLWFDKGVDWRGGGYFEYLNLNDLKCHADYKRVRVLARQIYVFTAACKLGETNAKPAVIHGLEFLLDKYRLAEGGFASRRTIRGETIEGPLDLYDLAFCLYALAQAYSLLGDSHLKDQAVSLTIFIKEQFAHNSGGFSEALPASLPRRQNPHMHLLEALLEWRRLTGDVLFSEMSDAIILLFFDKFYFPDSGALLEYFDDELKPAPGGKGIITEPGHHFEWIWLLERYNKISGNSLKPYSKLYDFACSNGVNARNGFLWGEVTSAGEPSGLRVRLWPHTEWIKAELTFHDPEHQVASLINPWSALTRFLDCSQPGLWYETFDHEKNMFLNEPAPASSLYHIVLAIEALNEPAKIQKNLS